MARISSNKRVSKSESRKHRIKANVQSMLDKAPVKGKKGGYIKLPKGIKFFQPKKSEEMRLVFLAWEAGNGNHEPKSNGTVNRYLKVHNNIGASENSILCPTSVRKPCPQCEDFASLRRKSREKSHWEAIKDMRPQDREMFLVHDLDGEKDNVQVWEESCFNFGDHLRKKLSRKKEYRDFTDPDVTENRVVAILGSEKQLGNGGKFTAYDSIEFEDLEDDIDLNGVYDKAAVLCPDDWLILYDYKAIKKMIEDEPEEEEEETPARGKKKGKDDDDEPEEEEEEEAEEPEEEEDETPAYKKGDTVLYKRKPWTITFIKDNKMKLKNDAGKTAEISDPSLVSLVEEEEEEVEEEPEEEEEEPEEPEEEEEAEEEEEEEPEEEEEEDEKPKRGRKPARRK